MNKVNIEKADLDCGFIGLVKLIIAAKLAPSNLEARRKIEQGAVFWQGKRAWGVDLVPVRGGEILKVGRHEVQVELLGVCDCCGSLAVWGEMVPIPGIGAMCPECDKDGTPETPDPPVTASESSTPDYSPFLLLEMSKGSDELLLEEEDGWLGEKEGMLYLRVTNGLGYNQRSATYDFSRIDEDILFRFLQRRRSFFNDFPENSGEICP